MRWLATTLVEDFRKGGRFFVGEQPYIVGEARPAYSIGDVFDVAPGNRPGATGQIVAVAPDSFDVEVDGVTLRMTSTPPNGLPAPFTSRIPQHDVTGVVV